MIPPLKVRRNVSSSGKSVQVRKLLVDWLINCGSEATKLITSVEKRRWKNLRKRKNRKKGSDRVFWKEEGGKEAITRSKCELIKRVK